MFDIITLGSATIDSFVNTENKLFTHHKNKNTIPFGSKININSLHTCSGGGGTNTAVAFSRLGLKTAFLGVIGNDHNGEGIITELKKEHVQTHLIQRTDQPTGQSIILESNNHDRIILAHKGCNNNLTITQKTLKSLQTKAIYSSALLEESFTSFLNIINYATQHNIPITFNPSAYQIRAYRRQIIDILPKITTLIFNREEANLLLGKKSITSHLHNIYKKGVSHIAITNGKSGAYIYANGNMFHCIAPDVHIIETTGAGDAFASGFTAGLIKTKDAQQAASIGMTNATSVIQYYGAKKELLRWNEATKKKVKIRDL